MPEADYFEQYPYELNAYIAGYIGFLRLQELAGRTVIDGQLRITVTNELNRILQLRANTFNKDSRWIDDNYHKRSLNISRNFIMLVPELGTYLNQHILARVQAAIAEYEYVAPYWFVSRYEAIMNEGAMSPIYNASALFQAKAYILKDWQRNPDCKSIPGYLKEIKTNKRIEKITGRNETIIVFHEYHVLIKLQVSHYFSATAHRFNPNSK